MTLERLHDILHCRINGLIEPLVLRLGKAGVTPNAMTYAGLAVSSAAAALLAGGMLRTAGVVWLVGSALDMLDGALARSTGAVNRQGAFLDSSCDRISEGLLLTAAVYHFADQGLALVAAVSAFALLASFMVSYTRARAEGLGVECKGGLATRAERVILLGLGLLLELLVIAIGVLAIVAAITTVQRLVNTRKTLSEGERAGT
jgi:CDP-diacylglycerol---glycerol-3-phosphate 3-phosphatidyltransferase